ncbi:T9SS type A sorting domain-containing protein [Neptunitalea lumnitzerae]|uniref:Chromosome condensation regulator n=1 Tax=Neptunitalea lumnitzerae TaxID=2965509 RepID=A0ABQ5MH81_9FLAO|nr:T9SS type A sorting domain-containing protein [Neptunitalea sp. Y10]GLB48744.1 chromosome condensation regulator [Neptunitalea sp. Y10]
MKKQLLNLTFILIIGYMHGQCFSELRLGGHVVTVKTDGTLWGWGYGGWGQLANAAMNNPSSPVQIGTMNNWVSAYNGLITTFGVKQDGSLWGVGGNSYGCLGVGSSAQDYYTSFQQVTSYTDWVDVRGAYFFTVGLRANGTIWAWGQGDQGQMGNGTTPMAQPTPTQVGTDTDWASIAVDASRTAIAIKNNGTVWGWGANTGYMLYAGSSVTSYTLPTQLNTDTDWAKVCLGGHHVLAQKTDGTLWVWGGAYDAMGVGQNYVDVATPAQIGTDTWRSFTADPNASFGVKSDGTLWAWGFNTEGELGDGTTINQPLPVQIGTDADWVSVITKLYAPTIAVKEDGSVWAWGDNTYGTYGNGTYTNSLTPVEVIGICVDTPLTTPEFEQPTIRLYPNPTTDKVTIDSALNLTEYTITNLLGQTVAKGTLIEGQKEIDMQAYSLGTYIVHLTTTSGANYTYKIVKH